MNSKLGFGRLLAAVAALVFVAAACGSTGGSGNPSPASKGTLTVAGFNFPESSILAEIYGQALAHDGYTINYKLLLGTREVVAPALESGQIDLYPGYAATDLEFYNKGAGEVAAWARRARPLGSRRPGRFCRHQGHPDQVQPHIAVRPRAHRWSAHLRRRPGMPDPALLPARTEEHLWHHFQGLQGPRHRWHRRRPGLQQRRRPQLARAGRAQGRQAPGERGQRRADPPAGRFQRRGQEGAERHRRQADNRRPGDDELAGVDSAPGCRCRRGGMAAAAQLRDLAAKRPPL